MVNQNSIFGGMLTTVGAAKKTNCDALGVPWQLSHMLIGDANGADPVPNPGQAKLINQVYRAPLNQLYVSPTDPNVLVAELVLPPNVGGWWIRELALEDVDGVFSVVANCAPSYKPLLVQNSGRNQVVRMHIVTSGTANIQLKIDPSVVLATREFVTEELAKQDFKHSVLVATTGPIVLSGLQAVDTVALTAGAAVLVKDQSTAKENGIYVVAAGAWTRRADADTSTKVAPGLLVHVEKGAINGDGVWQLVTDGPINLGVSALVFEMAFGRTGVAAGTYRSVTVDKYGRVVGAANPTTLAGYGITDAQAFAQILADFVTNKGWGLGQNTPSLVTDANTAIYPGFYSAGGLGATNFGDAYSPLMVMRRQSGNIIGQLQINARDNVLMFRGSADNGATWTPWVSTWHSGNLFKTISPTDTTPGAMLKVADHGIGGQCVSAETNLDLYTSGGKYITPSSGIVGLPAGWAQGRHTLEVCGGAAYREQRLTGVSVNLGRSAFRTWNGLAYSAWKEYFHTGNFDPFNLLAPDAMGGFSLGYSGTADLVVSPGRARDAADTTDIVLTAAVTRRLQASGSWLSGSPASGLFSGVKASSTWYHIFAIKNPSTGAVDVGFDTSVIAANRPADYTAYRRLGSFRTDASGNVVPFVMTLQSGGARYFRWVTPIMEALDATLTTAAVSLTLSVPPGVSVNAELNAWIYSNNILAYFSPLDTADLALSSSSSGGSQTGFTGGYGSITGDGIDSLGFKVDVQTDTASRIRARCNLAAGKYSLMTLGWTE